MKTLYLLLTALCIASFTAHAQLSITGEVNARAEFRNGFKRPILDSQDPAFFIEQRSRLYMNYKAEKFEVQFNLQDVRMWGGDGQVYKGSSAMTAIHNAWGRYYFTDAVSIKAGRQTISYDNQRFFGGLEWAMQGRQHDALLFMYEKDGLKLHVGGAFNQNPADGAEPVRLVSTNYSSPGVNPYHATGNYKHMEYLWLNKKFESGLTGSFYLVNEGRQDMVAGVPQDTVNNRQTYGLMVGAPVGDQLTLNGEFFYQGGKVAAKRDLSALMFSVSATLKTDITPITLGIDYLSGDDTSTTDKSEAFAPAFGTNHAFYGFMDYFYVGNGNRGGLQDIFLKTKFKVAGGALLGHLHYFMSASDVTALDGTGTADKGLGTEIDLVYVKKLADGVTWKLGYSHMFETESMLASKTGVSGMTYTTSSEIGTNNWIWTQLIFKPKFL
ncbi:alginate export family protein [Reichenbachiella ulvae]|uniref:Alginate export family protein n=1 Tax=Reichenbachiella ulvae TaxID=2980104 RepID=A0ABT3CWV1_9BACT|nr:alginate export family protein [Reichenbachiella ulvae]MCV9388173.1 alginate export family protein [Reichenbachiella ulvae]